MEKERDSNDFEAILNKFTDWRGLKLAHIRSLMRQADPGIAEDVKWKTPSNPEGVAVWYHDGMICTGEVYKEHLRISFAKGPQLDDPSGLINSYRAIIIREGDILDDKAFVALVKNAVELNQRPKKS